jgi:hypothetical protein
MIRLSALCAHILAQASQAINRIDPMPNVVDDLNSTERYNFFLWPNLTSLNGQCRVCSGVYSVYCIAVFRHLLTIRLRGDLRRLNPGHDAPVAP